MVALMTLLFSAVQPGPPRTTTDPSIEARIDELESANAKKRKMAAMSLRRMTKKYTRTADREHGDEVQIMEARQALMVFDDELTRTCIEQLAVSNLTGLCADILGLLGNEKAEAPLESQLQREERRGVARRIEKALEAIREP
jgi:predicted homoserine dehydrogenase-like protein